MKFIKKILSIYKKKIICVKDQISFINNILSGEDKNFNKKFSVYAKYFIPLVQPKIKRSDANSSIYSY